MGSDLCQLIREKYGTFQGQYNLRACVRIYIYKSAFMEFTRILFKLISVFMAIIILIISIFSFILYVYRLYPWLRYKLPPGPYPWPVMGNLYDIEPDRCRCFAEWSKIYGPIMSVWIGSSLNVIVSSSELAKEVLKDNDHQLADRHRPRTVATISKDGADMIWADYGSHYVKVRKVCTLELFSAKRVEALRSIREYEVRSMIGSIRRDTCTTRSLILRKYLSSVAFNNITRLVFGKRFENEEGELDAQGREFRAIVATEFELGLPQGLVEHISWLSWILRLGNDEMITELSARKEGLTRAILEEHKAENVKSGHFVDALLGLRDKYELSEDTIMGLLWNMVTAGMDTVATTVEWAMAEIVKNPRTQPKTQEELDRVVGPNRVMIESDIVNLPYLQCVVKEAMRLHPPTPLMLPHRANAHVKIGGFDIPKKTVVFVNVWAIARDPLIWTDPSEFKPERFLRDHVDIKGHDFRLLPFGAGRRVCPAAQLSMNLVTLMLGQLLHHFRWTPPPEGIDMSDSAGIVSYMQTPLQIVPTRRLPEHVL